ALVRNALEANRLGDQGASLGDRVSEISKKNTTLRSPPGCRATRRSTCREGGGAKKISNGTEIIALSNANCILPARCSNSAVSSEGEREGRRPHRPESHFFRFRTTTATGAPGLFPLVLWDKSNHDGWTHISDGGGHCVLSPRRHEV
ncbi:unnamed protein product, partial [Ectocarpus sp. 8 AP-2014]